jgi:broad specificity phosphatase PhoE
MATRLYLVRHGATELTAEDRFSGAGVDLSDEGRDQARRLAARLSPHPIRAVYCSPFRRAAKTAQILLDGKTTYFLGRETLIASQRPGMAVWREKLFALLSRNALRATTFFRIPADKVFEVGVQVEL